MRRHIANLSQVVIALSRPQKYVILLTMDVVLISVSAVLAAWVWYPAILAQPLGFSILVGAMMVMGLVTSVGLGLPRIKLNSYEALGMQRTTVFALLVGLVGALGMRAVLSDIVSYLFIVVFAMLLILLSVAGRMVMRSVVVWFYQRGTTRQRVLIYGAGQTGMQLATALGFDNAIEPVAFMDDSPSLRKVTVAGLPVYSPVRATELVKSLNIDRVVLAMPSVSRPKQARLVRHLAELGCEVATLPSFATLVGEGALIDRIEALNAASYLGRDGLDDELTSADHIYRDGCVMITGAGGSIGAELARQIMVCAPRKLVLFDVSEAALYQIDRELRDLNIQYASCDVVPILGSVTDRAVLTRAIVQHEVGTVIHAAAYKHVTLVERNSLAGLHNNVMGTRILIDTVREAGVGHFILVSTDKAVHPTNVMGASKRLAELLVQDAATRSDPSLGGTRFGIVRFGNVLGSSGSVVPLFEEQIARGGPVTLTHAQVTRYFMTVSEAARLVLLVGSQADEENDQGQVYVLDMGTPVLIEHLARQMIMAAGYTVCDADAPDGDIEIIITGLRPGEKMHEELVMRGHSVTPTAQPKILRVDEARLSEIEVAAALRALTLALDKGDDAAAGDVLRRWAGLFPTSAIDQPLASVDDVAR